tara:strand:- start:310 stop:492 length:183 start_codon:yes stop_codon:yes gene_type:complete
MENYTIANKNVGMNNHWLYALSVEGRKAFEKGSKEIRMQILMQLLSNGNITMPKLIQIMS